MVRTNLMLRLFWRKMFSAFFSVWWGQKKWPIEIIFSLTVKYYLIFGKRFTIKTVNRFLDLNFLLLHARLWESSIIEY
jgi:hypothetical protein